MNKLLDVAHLLLDPIALIMALILLVSIAKRRGQNELRSKMLMAMLFSVALILSMSDPIDLGEGGIHDMRSLLIGSAAALIGPVVGLITLATGLAMRIGIGGTGMMPGLVAMLGAFFGALLWRHYFFTSTHLTWVKSVTLGMFISFHLVGVLLFPFEIAVKLLLTMGPFYVIGNIIGSFVICHLLGGELSFQSEAESIKTAANTDHLTGLLNRRGLEHVLPSLKTEFTANRGRALLYFDIDHFKAANDTFGHAVGDDVLTQVSARISENLRRHDVFARMGGDEFAVILPDVDANEANHIAERCRAVVADEVFANADGMGPITISLGAVWLHQPDDISLMLKAADHALYQAKHGGRNAVVFLSNLRDIALCLERSNIG
ncbi:MAG: diguanylate cyclase, partial [Octadecabacter sp.]